MNLFELERRTSLRDEVYRLNQLIINNRIKWENDGEWKRSTLYELIDDTFLKWDKRDRSISMFDYFQSIDIFEYYSDILSMLTSDQIDDEEHPEFYLYFLQFLMNYILDSTKFDNFKYEDQSLSLLKAILDNIKIVLEKLNYTHTNIENSIIFRKRDSQLDAAIQSIDDKSIKLDLLSYLDFRNKENIKEKSRIIMELSNYLDGQQIQKNQTVKFKNSEKEKDIRLFDNFKDIVNNFGVRHWPEEINKANGTHEIDNKDKLELLNIAYYLVLQIINSNQIVENDIRLKQLKDNYKLKK